MEAPNPSQGNPSARCAGTEPGEPGVARGLERGRVCLKARPGPWSSESRMGGCRATRSNFGRSWRGLKIWIRRDELAEVCLDGEV